MCLLRCHEDDVSQRDAVEGREKSEKKKETKKHVLRLQLRAVMAKFGEKTVLLSVRAHSEKNTVRVASF